MNGKELPSWASKPFDMFTSQIKEIGEVTDLSIKAIKLMQSFPQLLDTILVAPNEEDKENIEKTRHLGDLARREVERGFPLLLGQSVMALWSSIELFVKDFLIIWLKNEPTSKSSEIIKKIRVPIVQYEEMDTDERYSLVVDLLERELQSPLRRGISRFEVLLSTVGLGGNVNDETQKILFELASVRNCLAHNRGIADRRFIESCPWLNYTIGQSIVVSEDSYKKYEESTVDYVMTIFDRICKKYGVEVKKK